MMVFAVDQATHGFTLNTKNKNIFYLMMKSKRTKWKHFQLMKATIIRWKKRIVEFINYCKD